MLEAEPVSTQEMLFCEKNWMFELKINHHYKSQNSEVVLRIPPKNTPCLCEYFYIVLVQVLEVLL